MNPTTNLVGGLSGSFPIADVEKEVGQEIYERLQSSVRGSGVGIAAQVVLPPESVAGDTSRRTQPGHVCAGTGKTKDTR